MNRIIAAIIIAASFNAMAYSAEDFHAEFAPVAAAENVVSEYTEEVTPIVENHEMASRACTKNYISGNGSVLFPACSVSSNLVSQLIEITERYFPAWGNPDFNEPSVTEAWAPVTKAMKRETAAMKARDF